MVSLENIKNIAVIGGGLMGAGIAQVALLSGYEKVTVVDLKGEILEKCRKEVQKRLEELESKKHKEIYLEATGNIEVAKSIDFETNKDDFKVIGVLANRLSINTLMGRFKTETDISKGVSDADFVIEAVPEVMSLKQEIFKKLGQFAPSHTVLASNTSVMSITNIGKFSGREDRVIGFHFHVFYPLLGIVIEITPGERTSEDSMSLGVEFSQRLPCLIGERFTVRLEKESPGLIANRATLPMMLYHNWLLKQAISEGISYEQLDAAGMSFETFDRIGIDTIYNVIKYFEEVVSPDFAPADLLTNLVKEGRLGRKVGKGYYDWDENGPIRRLPSVEPKIIGFLAQNLDAETLTALSLNESCKLLEEGVVKSYDTITKVLMKGNFIEGPFIQGKEKYKEWSQKLYKIAEKTGIPYLKPCEMMESGRFLSYK
ncbi:MAG: 3-hydroxyacyl-CoA dehydrogenase family protein [Promethearchaeota archaeon]|jgi:enoyl-CoA hydratase/3-hydroxyacyl-CoA dehydrogenase